MVKHIKAVVYTCLTVFCIYGIADLIYGSTCKPIIGEGCYVTKIERVVIYTTPNDSTVRDKVYFHAELDGYRPSNMAFVMYTDKGEYSVGSSLRLSK